MDILLSTASPPGDYENIAIPFSLEVSRTTGLNILFETRLFVLEIKNFDPSKIEKIKTWLGCLPTLIHEYLSVGQETQLHRWWYAVQETDLKEPFCLALVDIAKGSFESGNIDPLMKKADLINSILGMDFPSYEDGKYQGDFRGNRDLSVRCLDCFNDPRIMENLNRLLNKSSHE